MKALEIKQTKFKRIPHLFTDDNQYFVVSRIQLYQSIVFLLTDIESQKSNIAAILNGLGTPVTSKTDPLVKIGNDFPEKKEAVKKSAKKGKQHCVDKFPRTNTVKILHQCLILSK